METIFIVYILICHAIYIDDKGAKFAGRNFFHSLIYWLDTQRAYYGFMAYTFG